MTKKYVIFSTKALNLIQRVVHQTKLFKRLQPKNRKGVDLKNS